MEALQPYVGQITFGGLAGFVAGYALKKVGKVTALVLGLFFIGLQLMAYYGLVEINWTRIQASVEPLLGEEQLRTLWQRLLDVLTYNAPFAGGFTAGLVLGLKKG
ncbi:FUN14 domain-containing protein [Oceanithermus sp.]|uniref:FUN14 domain-containing protein n=1 Tax=Oceanithermus sp. TaxID=2268145 RepID=UPI0026001CDD|nr:FUN14 domain-containing protein [Oceanithermus sp.]